MSLFKNIFGKKEKETAQEAETSIHSYTDFWNWFKTQEKKFYSTVKDHKNIEIDFFNQLSPKLDQLKKGIVFLTGMSDDNTVELILTADGYIKNFYFIEELVVAAPKINGWKFTAHKPAIDIKNQSINMREFKFGSDNMSFYANDWNEYPDEISIMIVHDDFNEKHKEAIINGSYIFLDNYLGELNFATTIDDINFIEKSKAEQELVPIKKLKSYLIWREKEFVEKYEGVRCNINDDSYVGLEAELKNGNPLVAIVNSDLLTWDSKASHPWILTIDIKFNGEENSGMPDADTYDLLNKVEDEMMEELKDFEGYLNVGRQTADGVREVYFACIDFRKPCKIIDTLIKKYSNQITIDYDIYKDKYWRSFERFQS